MNPLPADPHQWPLGATVHSGGVAFRTWAPRALDVWVIGDFSGWAPTDAGRLQNLGDETWAVSSPQFSENSAYLFWIHGSGNSGPKRDPRARVFTFQPNFPDCRALARDPDRFPWHDTPWRPRPFHQWVLYQLHVGTFRIAPGNRGGKFLDVALQLPYFEKLGINALQLMPIVEFETEFSLGYNGCDYFSPENQYAEDSPADLEAYRLQLNALLAAKGFAGYPDIAVLQGADNQFKALVDVCHVWGIGVLCDVVYNHAGGFDSDDKSLYFFDRKAAGNNNDSLYFTDQGWAGGLVFAYWNRFVRQFLIDHTLDTFGEFRIDGLRFDEVSVMDRYGGWQTCQDLTSTSHFAFPDRILIAEYWPVKPQVVSAPSDGGAGFDASWQDSLRDSVRSAVLQASYGQTSRVDLDAVANALSSQALPNRWRAVNCVENHDIIKLGAAPRVPHLADGSNPRSWYARSRSRVALGLVVIAPGIPMIFMGQEILEEKPWNDNPNLGLMPDWSGLGAGDPVRSDFLRFSSASLALRRDFPALAAEGCCVLHTHSENRVLAIHRWVEGQGDDVIGVFNLRDSAWFGYDIGFPTAGEWLEVFNSDAYESGPGYSVSGNAGRVQAHGPPLHGFSTSASLVLPANGFVVFSRRSP